MNQGRLNHNNDFEHFKEFLDNLDLVSTANEFVQNNDSGNYLDSFVLS